MMTRFVLTLLIGLVVSLGALGSLGPNAAFAETFDCNRHTQGNSSFKSQSDFDYGSPLALTSIALSMAFATKQSNIRML